MHVFDFVFEMAEKKEGNTDESVFITFYTDEISSNFIKPQKCSQVQELGHGVYPATNDGLLLNYKDIFGEIMGFKIKMSMFKEMVQERMYFDRLAISLTMALWRLPVL